MTIVDTAPRWRAVDDLAAWKRALGGGLQFLRDYARFTRELRRRPGVIHLTTSGGYAALRDLGLMRSAFRAGVPVIYHIRFGRIPQIARGNTREWRLMSRALGMAHTVVAIDELTRQAVTLNSGAQRVVCIPNCVDVSSLPEPAVQDGSPRTVVFLGWVIATKGIAELVQAWKDIDPAGWKLVIAGPGSADYQNELMQAIEPSRVTFAGELDHDAAMGLLAAADVFVLPSHTEGFPNVVLEAMALGKPIVATNVGAVPEMLADGCGILIDPKNVEDLRQALESLLGDATLRVRLGVAARQKALREYNIDCIFQKYMDIWRAAATEAQETIDCSQTKRY